MPAPAICGAAVPQPGTSSRMRGPHSPLHFRLVPGGAPPAPRGQLRRHRRRLLAPCQYCPGTDEQTSKTRCPDGCVSTDADRRARGASHRSRHPGLIREDAAVHRLPDCALAWRLGAGGTVLPASASARGMTTSSPEATRTVKEPASAASRIPRTSATSSPPSRAGRRKRSTTRCPTSVAPSRTSSR